MPKPTIHIYDSIGTGLIIECQSGVVVSNQTGGSSCLQPEIEGIYIPLRNDYSDETGEFMSPENELTKHFTGSKHAGAGATSGIDEDDADFIDSVLTRVKLNPPILVDRRKLTKSHEAWIHVEISGNESADADLSAFVHFDPYPRSGILTWCNSD